MNSRDFILFVLIFAALLVVSSAANVKTIDEVQVGHVTKVGKYCCGGYSGLPLDCDEWCYINIIQVDQERVDASVASSEAVKVNNVKLKTQDIDCCVYNFQYMCVEWCDPELNEANEKKFVFAGGRKLGYGGAIVMVSNN